METIKEFILNDWCGPDFCLWDHVLPSPPEPQRMSRNPVRAAAVRFIQGGARLGVARLQLVWMKRGQDRGGQRAGVPLQSPGLQQVWMKRGRDPGAESRCPSSEPRAPASLLVLRGEWCLSGRPPGRGQGTPHTPHLGAQGIPGACPQLVGLGFRHVCPLLRVVQLVLGLSILGQVSVGLLLLRAQAGLLTLWSLRVRCPRRGQLLLAL